MTDILEAINNIINQSQFNITNLFSGKNRINNVGEGLENFIKNAFANTFTEENETFRLQKFSEVYSWLGNQNHPPDLMIKNGDAIEVKKIQSPLNDLALNSSYPKSTLLSSSKLITNDCRNCEDWKEKDLLYSIGYIDNEELKSLFFVYGNIYAANHDIYEIIKEKISSGIKEIPNVEFAESKELGRVNRVDPLGITNLRIRGMWQIQNPKKVFDYILNNEKVKFELTAIIPISKYNSFPIESRNKLENLSIDNFLITNSKVKNPNNPATLLDVKLITFKVT